MAVESISGQCDVSEPRRLDLPVVGRRPAGRDYTRLALDAPPDWRSLPGQFVNILCESDPAAARTSEGRPLDDADGAEWPRTTGLELARKWPVVRRPLSVSRVFRDKGRVRLELLVRTVGPGTRFLGTRPVGASLDVVGPLGNAFTPPEDDRLCLLVGGGCGLAPIFGLADYLAGLGRRCLCLLGAKTAAEFPVTFRDPPQATGDEVVRSDAVLEFAESGVEAVLATDDGSAGFRGTVVAALEPCTRSLLKGAAVALYGCGPLPMLRGLSQVAEAQGMPCQVSLEGFMGCGIGVCLSCATPRHVDSKRWTYRLTCREGPVVDAREIVWTMM